ncbi:MAG: DUF2927 domain-containing protein [Pseudomonadota bacterium]
MRKALVAVLLAGLALSFGTARAADDLAEARVILNAKQGTVKKWHYAPRFVVVHDRPVDRAAFAEVTEFIAAATGLTLAVPDFVEVTAETLGERFYTASRYAPRATRAGQMTTDLLIAGHEDLQLSANVFIFVVSPPLASHFMVLTAWGRSSTALPRAYVTGEGPCYFNVLSNAQSIHFGTILIAPELEKAVSEACIYEEMMQAMGLMNDAHGSAHFTFDNLAEAKPRDYDQRLLSALYDADVLNGDAVEKVLGIYAGAR